MSDVICDELPDWHIEVKGTKSGVLTKSQLRPWYDQVERDCPKDKKAVIFNKANAWELIVLLPFSTFKQLKPHVFNVRIEARDSLAAAEELLTLQTIREIETFTGLHTATEPVRLIEGIYYGVAPSKILVIMLATTWLTLVRGTE